MSIPDYQTLMLPTLQVACDDNEHRFRDVVEALAIQFGLTDEERSELLPSGQQPLFTNRVGWARTYLKHAGLLDSPRRGFLRITQRGRDLLAENPVRVDLALLRRFDEFVDFQSRRRINADAASVEAPPTDSEETPEDTLSRAYGALRKEVEAQLLDTVTQVSPTFFSSTSSSICSWRWDMAATGWTQGVQSAGAAMVARWHHQ
jgi:restriction system protein